MSAGPVTAILSDLHAGAAESLLTVLDADNRAVPSQPSPVTRDFGAAFGQFMAALNPAAPPNLVSWAMRWTCRWPRRRRPHRCCRPSW